MKENTTRPGYFGTGKGLMPLAIMVLALCAISFYLGGAFYSTSDTVIGDKADRQAVSEKVGCTPLSRIEAFPECNITTQDITPCTDPKVSSSLSQFLTFFHTLRSFFEKDFCLCGYYSRKWVRTPDSRCLEHLSRRPT